VELGPPPGPTEMLLPLKNNVLGYYHKCAYRPTEDLDATGNIKQQNVLYVLFVSKTGGPTLKQLYGIPSLHLLVVSDTFSKPALTLLKSGTLQVPRENMHEDLKLEGSSPLVAVRVQHMESASHMYQLLKCSELKSVKIDIEPISKKDYEKVQTQFLIPNPLSMPRLSDKDVLRKYLDLKDHDILHMQNYNAITGIQSQWKIVTHPIETFRK
jgi:hypothetical protein